ncbi:pH-response regulator protein palI/RIM9 [Nematolebias whitei]|uniref:pH-response regulator protein palI/RIM9 n=1 Tax=Nematolebias whitei TaxID=451745 RepID=UPI00189B18D2|nr:pH-response regulator protein palI/RIM9 [Nematolebias whitei]
MNMKSFSVLCMSLLLFHTPFLLAKRGGGFGKSFGSKKVSTSNRGSTNTNKASNNNQGSASQGGYPKQQGQNNQGGYPVQGGYYNQYPGRGSPYGGGYGGYPGGYINYNPNNRILSPRYGGSFGYGGYNSRGGSPFSQSVSAMGIYPGARSKGFGSSAAMAAAGGSMAGMALGYGLGSFPRPHFKFHNTQEEYYYNHYMYRKYGTRSSDSNNYSRDYKFNQPPQGYESYMDMCMKRTDLLPANNQNSKTRLPASTTTKDTDSSLVTFNNNTGTTKINSSAVENSMTPVPSTPLPLNQPYNDPSSSAEDDDTVSIVEIGYPALIEQLKAKRCLELYMVYAERYLVKQTGGAQGLKMNCQGLISVISLMVINNILMLVQ